MIEGYGRDIAHADAEKCIYKHSDRLAAAIRRPDRPNDPWEVIKKGAWKAERFFV